MRLNTLGFDRLTRAGITISRNAPPRRRAVLECMPTRHVIPFCDILLCALVRVPRASWRQLRRCAYTVLEYTSARSRLHVPGALGTVHARAVRYHDISPIVCLLSKDTIIYNNHWVVIIYKHFIRHINLILILTRSVFTWFSQTYFFQDGRPARQPTHAADDARRRTTG